MKLIKTSKYGKLLAFTVLTSTILLNTTLVQAKTFKLGSMKYESIGNVNATIDGKKHKMYTITGKHADDNTISATWTTSEDEMKNLPSQMDEMADFLPPELKEQMELMFGGNSDNNPFLDAMKSMAGSSLFNETHINLHAISSSSKKYMGDNTITLDITIDNNDNNEPTNRSHNVNITFVEKGGEGFIPEVFYVSDEEHKVATVTFEKLSIEGDSGFAKGQFEGELCRMERQKMMQGPDLDNCFTISGSFDTKLFPEHSK